MGQIAYEEISKYRYRLTNAYMIQTDIRPPEHIITYYIVLKSDGVLLFDEGYAWNGTNFPAINTKNNRRASLIHDGLYQLMNLRLLDIAFREAADYEFYKTLLADGMNKVRAWVEWKGVRIGGGPFARPDGKAEIDVQYAP